MKHFLTGEFRDQAGCCTCWPQLTLHHKEIGARRLTLSSFLSSTCFSSLFFSMWFFALPLLVAIAAAPTADGMIARMKIIDPAATTQGKNLFQFILSFSSNYPFPSSALKMTFSNHDTAGSPCTLPRNHAIVRAPFHPNKCLFVCSSTQQVRPTSFWFWDDNICYLFTTVHIGALYILIIDAHAARVQIEPLPTRMSGHSTIPYSFV